MNMIKLFVLAFALTAFTACGGASQDEGGTSTEEAPSETEMMMEETETDEVAETGKEYTSAYVCPMHCEGSGSDEPGKCPACNMDYVKNEKHEMHQHEGHDHEGHEHHHEEMHEEK